MQNDIYTDLVRLFEYFAPFAARSMLAIAFLFSALGKLPGSESFAIAVALSEDAGLPLAHTMVSLAFILEVITSVMLLLGWHARVAAFLLAGFVFLIGATFVRDLTNQMDVMILFTCMQLIAALFYVATYGARTLAIRPDKDGVTL